MPLLRRLALQDWTRAIVQRYRDQVPPMRRLQPHEAGRAPIKGVSCLWLYLPEPMKSEASRCAPASGDLNWDCTSQNRDTELCVTSSGKPSLRRSSWPGWQTRPWRTLLCGTTLSPSMAALGAARFISSLADTHASPSVLRESASARTILAISGRTSGGSSARSHRGGASSRTSRDTSPWAPPKSSETFARWATASKQACFRRSRWARPRYGVGSSFWPTPTKGLYTNRVELELSATGLRMRDDPHQVGSQISIGKAARLWTMIWMLVRACGGRPKGDFEFHSSLRLHMSLEPGGRYSAGDLTYNPSFSDWIMGWPIGWTDPTQPVTGWSAWLQRMRGALSELPSIDIVETAFDGSSRPV